jgi:predicted RND superfamily exporter protein
VTRLRAVLLTALITILGMLPMAPSRSEGPGFRALMAITVLGGLTATAFLTLFVIPIIYNLFERLHSKRPRPLALKMEKRSALAVAVKLGRRDDVPQKGLKILQGRI